MITHRRIEEQEMPAGTKQRTQNMSPLDRLISKYTTLWARTPIRNPKMRVYQDILNELRAQKELGNPFEDSAETFQRRINRTHDPQLKQLYENALSDVQKAMNRLTRHAQTPPSSPHS